MSVTKGFTSYSSYRSSSSCVDLLSDEMPTVIPHNDKPIQDGTTNKSRAAKRLILCFDGTGNNFQGNTGDTNIVKLLDMFDRSSPNQMHYYQRK